MTDLEIDEELQKIYHDFANFNNVMLDYLREAYKAGYASGWTDSKFESVF
jgi:hypothetical protein